MLGSCPDREKSCYQCPGAGGSMEGREGEGQCRGAEGSREQTGVGAQGTWDLGDHGRSWPSALSVREAVEATSPV